MIARMVRYMRAVLLVLTAAGAQAASLSALSPGVLLDAHRGLAWVADSDGYALALNLIDGSSRWRSQEPAFPLTVLDGRLLALGNPQQLGQGVVLVIDSEGGAIRDRVVFDLPDSIRGIVGAHPSSQFEVSAEHLGGAVRIHWQYRSSPLSSPLSSSSESRQAVVEESGAVEVGFEAGRAFALPLRAKTSAPVRAVRTPDPEQQIASVSGRQFLAAEGGAVMVSELVASESAFPYQWTVYDRARTRLGSLRASTARADFVIVEQRIYFRSPPYGYRNQHGRWQETPERLVVYDLLSGVQLWSIAILDRAYRGPMPP